MARRLAHAGLILLICLPSVRGRTVYDIPSLRADLGYDPPRMSTSFELTVQTIFPPTPQDKDFVVTDGTNVIKLVDKAHWPRIAFSANDILHVRGKIEAKGNPDCSAIEVIGKSAPAPVVETTIAEALRRNLNGKVVRLHGTVRTALHDEVDPEWDYLTIADKDQIVHAQFKPSASDRSRLRSLVGAEVSVTGLLRIDLWPKPRRTHLFRILPASLLIWSLDNLTVTRPAPPDPFDVSALDAASRLNFRAGTRERRAAVGSVIATYDRNKMLLRDMSNSVMNVELSENDLPAFGSRVKVVGTLATDLYRINLTDAIWRKESDETLAPEPPEDVRLDDLLTDGHGHVMLKPACHGQAIRIKGTVRALPGPASTDLRMIVESGSSLLPVDVANCPQVLGDICPGCEISVAGTCVMPTPNWQPNASFPRIREVFVALRTEDDIRVIRRPPWWTAQRLLMLVAALVAGLAVITVWNRLLKRKVEHRSHELLEEQIAHVTSDLKTIERTRLAIELHDSLAQNLTGVALELQTVQDIVREDLETGIAHLATASRSLTSCREELRNCLRDLRSEALETDDVNAAIRMTLDPHTADANVTIRFNVPRERLTDNTMHALLRIIRELVLNAIRHGHATAIRVAGAIENGKLLFSVADNGCGFDVESRPGLREGHFGLQGVHDRIRGFEGEMRIRSAIGRGTKVTLALTLPKEDSSCRS